MADVYAEIRGSARSLANGAPSLEIGGCAQGPARPLAVGSPSLEIGAAAQGAAAARHQAAPSLLIGAACRGPARTSGELLLRFLLAAASGPHFIVKFKPTIGGGGVITFDAGAPDVWTFWHITGYDPATGYEIEPHGSLKSAWVKADGAGLAVNRYVAPKDAAHAGKTDRVLVWKLDA